MRKIRNDLDQIIHSLKMPEVEEKYDIYFSRFLGFYIARVASKLHLTPTNITVLSMISGLIGGSLLYFQETLWITILGSFLLTLAGLFDSADGQLARMTGQSTEFGRILDGTVDTIVFIACYVGATAFYVLRPEPVLWYIPLSMAAGYVHNLKNGVYDLYKSEMLYYGGKFDDARNQTIDEVRKERDKASGLNRLLRSFYLDYLKRQFWGSTRKVHFNRFRALYSEHREEFSSQYLATQKGLLKWWAWVGGLNIHRWGIIISCLFVRFDLYLWITLGSLVTLFMINKAQLIADRKLLSHFDKS